MFIMLSCSQRALILVLEYVGNFSVSKTLDVVHVCMAESWARRLSLFLACKPFPGLCACTQTDQLQPRQVTQSVTACYCY